MRWRRVLRNPSRASILGEYVCCLICNRKWRFSRHDGKVNVELPCIWFCSGAVRDLSAYMTGRLVFGWHSVYPVFFLIWIGTSNNNGFDWHAFFTFFAQVFEEFVLCISINNKSFIVYKYVDEQNWYFLCRGLFIMFIWRT